ncbi:MAG: RNA ligase RtcB family protein [Pseudomonadota bacterium]
MGKHLKIINPQVTLVSDSSIWIEGKAIAQLEKTAQLPGMIATAGMPDLHPGRGYPIGAAFLSKNKLYPALVGNDIGCGMSLWHTNLKSQKFKFDKLINRLGSVDEPLDSSWEQDVKHKMRQENVEHLNPQALGTIGGGNHFAEFQQIDHVYDKSVVTSLGLSKQSVLLLIHSGSRGIGQQILRQHVEKFGHQGLTDKTDDAEEYLLAHNNALRFAELNRYFIAQRILQKIGFHGKQLFDINHNLVTPMIIDNERFWLHRKGATPSNEGMVIIPGSRGDYSYLLEPLPSKETLWSLAHGAGRKWMRSECKGRLSKRYSHFKELEKTPLGSRVICQDKALLYEEAPEAYKSINSIIDYLQTSGLVKVLARFKPLLTYKTKLIGR